MPSRPTKSQLEGLEAAGEPPVRAGNDRRWGRCRTVLFVEGLGTEATASQLELAPGTVGLGVGLLANASSDDGTSDAASANIALHGVTATVND